MLYYIYPKLPAIWHASLISPHPTPRPGTSVVSTPVSSVGTVIRQEGTEDNKQGEWHPLLLPSRYQHVLKLKLTQK